MSLHTHVVDLFDTHNYDGNLASNITHNINRGFSFWKKSFKEKKCTKQKSSDQRNSAPSILYYSGEKGFISDSDSPTGSLVVFPVFWFSLVWMEVHLRHLPSILSPTISCHFITRIKCFAHLRKKYRDPCKGSKHTILPPHLPVFLHDYFLHGKKNTGKSKQRFERSSVI